MSVRNAFHLAAAIALIPLPAAPVIAAASLPAAAAIQMDHISVQAIGAGSPVILIPGLASPRAVWDGIAPGLAQHHRVYLVQVNGFAGDDPRANLTPGVLAGIVADLHTMIVRERIGGAPVVGHSMGGLVGLMLAKAHPADIGRLMIVDSLPFFGVLVAPGGGATAASVAPVAAAARDKVAARYGKPVDPAAIAADTDRLALNPESKAKIAAWASIADPRVTAEALYEDFTTDLRPDLAAIAVPITLVFPWSAAAYGEAGTESYYRTQYAGVPHIGFVPVGESGHFVMLDRPAAFQAAVSAFMDRR